MGRVKNGSQGRIRKAECGETRPLSLKRGKDREVLPIVTMAVDVWLRGRGIGRVLLDICHYLYPTTRLDLLAAEEVRAFYKACGFRVIRDGMQKSYL